MQTLYDKLKMYAVSDYYGFHMPGHKRNKGLKGLEEVEFPYEIDITEIEGFDDLHHPKDLFVEVQKRAAALYGAQESHLLINGSTVGILSAILGTTRKGDKILMARNCHQSVYHAMFMNELRPVYLYPKQKKTFEINGEITVLEVERLLEENKDAKAVVIVSPTYDGVVSDVHGIAKVVHKRGIPLIVDEAHGAHFGFHPYFPQNANRQGADIVIHSLHKTLPAPTQTALLHMNGSIADRNNIEKYLHMLQSSSPSYILMAGIDICLQWLEEESRQIFDKYVRILEETRKKLKELKYLKLIETEKFDRSKILISTKGCKISGKKLYEILLEEYHLQMEMASVNYVTALTSAGDTKEGFERLLNALEEIDVRQKDMGQECLTWSFTQEMTSKKEEDFAFPRLRQVCKSSDIGEDGIFLAWEECEGKVAAEYAYIYPPGIPLIVPGEEINMETICLLKRYRQLGFQIEGTRKKFFIKVQG